MYFSIGKDFTNRSNHHNKTTENISIDIAFTNKKSNSPPPPKKSLLALVTISVMNETVQHHGKAALNPGVEMSLCMMFVGAY